MAAAAAKGNAGSAAPLGARAPAAASPRRQRRSSAARSVGARGPGAEAASGPAPRRAGGGRAPRRPISARRPPGPPAPASGAPRREGGLAGGPTRSPRLRRALCPPPFRGPGLLTSRPRPEGPWAETREEKGAARCAETQPCLRCLPDFWSSPRAGAPDRTSNMGKERNELYKVSDNLVLDGEHLRKESICLGLGKCISQLSCVTNYLRLGALNNRKQKSATVRSETLSQLKQKDEPENSEPGSLQRGHYLPGVDGPSSPPGILPSICPSIPQIPEHLPRDVHCWPWDFWGGQDGHTAAHLELTKPWGRLLLTSDAGRHRELWQGRAGRCARHQRESHRQAWGQQESTGVGHLDANASFPQTSGLRQELSLLLQQGGLSVDPGQEGGHLWAPGCGCGKDGRGCWGDLNAARTAGPGVSWGKGQVRKCPRGQRKPGMAGLAERDSFGRREPLPLRGPRGCKAEMLRPASRSERSSSPGSPLTAAGLAAPKSPRARLGGISVSSDCFRQWAAALPRLGLRGPPFSDSAAPSLNWSRRGSDERESHSGPPGELVLLALTELGLCFKSPKRLYNEPF
ncbi:unnamed protein product [Rangifer tarandus platyrhynchus]|uniref:Uncharacterized protein n=1 Tax=Rangifer tarandus platyrhynchus TaxID=3082113 RepID=A0ABN8ZEA9_RANTA|nr:unnamed protein product [Rangifer tarandus platyrhynchus]